MGMVTGGALSFVGVAAALLALTAGRAASTEPLSDSDGAEPLTTPAECSKGCTQCQTDCKGDITCTKMCSMQWSGCCMTAGMKPPGPGDCTCRWN
jgi:hypothetical protein